MAQKKSRGPGRPAMPEADKARALTVKPKPDERKVFQEYADRQRRELGPAIIFLALKGLECETGGRP